MPSALQRKLKEFKFSFQIAPEFEADYYGHNAGEIESIWKGNELEAVKVAHQSTLTDEKYFKDGIQLLGYYYPHAHEHDHNDM